MNKIFLLEVSVLKTASIILSSRSSQRYCLAQTLIKHQKHNISREIIVQTLKNRKQKAKINLFVGLPPNKRYRFTPLARHKDWI